MALLDHFVDVTRHLATVHPSRYRALLDGVTAVGWQHVRPVSDQTSRCAWSSSRTGSTTRTSRSSPAATPLGDLFTPELMRGGYRKKYFRAVSRLTALAREACGEVAHGQG